jgi:kynureninase
MSHTERTHAESLDAADPLAHFRDRFVLDDARIYLNGHSLGRLPRAAADRIGARVEEWGGRLVGAWSDWIDLPARIGDVLAETALGALPREVVLSDSTTVNLFKLAAAALEGRPRSRAIVTNKENFPTDRYVLEGFGELRCFESDPVEGPTPDDVAHACVGGDVALVSLSHVAYRSGAVADLPAITSSAHEAGALVLWDLSHSVGVLPIALEESGVDLAVGCTYKYLNCGPGAPAFLYVRRELQQDLRSPIWGWFGQRDQFAMAPRYDPVEDVTRFLAGTPAVLDLASVEANVELVAEAGIEAIRAKSEALTELVVELHDAWLAPLGFTLGSPRDAARRGAHMGLRHADAWRISQALIELAQVDADFRAPDCLRVGLPPLYTRFVDAWDALDRLRRLVEAGEHDQFDTKLARVT